MNPLLDAAGVAKSYGAVAALRNASLSVLPGEVHALLGANGAGKSTLVKILTGAVPPTSGRILIRGRELNVRSPAHARRSGLVPVYQEPSLIPDLSVIDNLRLNRTPVEAFTGFVRDLGLPDLDMQAVARDLPLAIVRVLDLARALAAEPDVLLLDEMTAALPGDLAERVLDVVRQQAATGKSVIFISHRFVEIAAVCNRATVLRDGETVGVVDIGPGIEEKIVELMLGARIEKRRAALARQDTEANPPKPVRIGVRNLKAGSKLHDVSFDLRDGEVTGVVALEGQGQDELFAALAGSAKALGGTIEVDGKAVSFNHPKDAIAQSIAYVPGNRADALLMHRSVRENIALPFTAPVKRWGPINMAREADVVGKAIKRLQIDTRAQGEVQRLSGGNQQKVTIARWIAADARTILCFDPTRGIDVGTKHEIYKLLRELAGQGKSVLFYTSELEEVPMVCDSVIAIFGGRVVDIMPATMADEATLTRASYGLSRQSGKEGAA